MKEKDYLTKEQFKWNKLARKLQAKENKKSRNISNQHFSVDKIT